jgi:lipopolysaccharide transport system ATP-binding protein
MRDVVVNGVRRVFGQSRDATVGGTSGHKEEFWALKDVNFEVKVGERVGIIGRNGAGKSTLLKVLSRITEPTTGRISISGRLASLLEVGTGFHPELTGRENIFLNGAVLGMSQAEIKSKFDEIVAFAEVEKFLDTPVKRYSSGMYVRLAFAVAAHLEPEILIVDEVLAVGDVQFQKKCLTKMDEAANTGKTILLVSHNMPTIISLSDKVLMLSHGQVSDYGDPQAVVSAFQRDLSHDSYGRKLLAGAEHYGTGEARFISILNTAYDSVGAPLAVPETGCDVRLDIEIAAIKNLSNITVAVIVYDGLGNRVVDACTLMNVD